MKTQARSIGGGGFATAALLFALVGCNQRDATKAGVQANVVSSASPSSASGKPEEVAAAFYESLEQGQFKQAHSYFSDYSAKHFEVDVAELIKQREKAAFGGTKTTEYKVVGTRELEPGIVLVDAWLKQTKPEQPPEVIDETLVMRKGARGWRINYGNLVAYERLNVPAEVKNKVSVRAVLVERFIDHTRFHFDVKNDNAKDTVHWGFPGERTLRVSYDHGPEHQVEGTHLEFAPGETKSVWIKVNGYQKALPKSIILERWARGMRFHDGKLPGGQRWTYEVDLGTAPGGEKKL